MEHLWISREALEVLQNALQPSGEDILNPVFGQEPDYILTENHEVVLPKVGLVNRQELVGVAKVEWIAEV
ncbi:hypothetical protein [Thermococcus sp.]|uniref:hypothetical protein n=1 Tax=Thermococcus sp. TaxID=35749 RepID=UPI0026174460|nr:hypothetical protein [Thermococcus sp.]